MDHDQHSENQSHSDKSEQNGHQNHHAHMLADFRRRFWISLILTVPVLVLSPLIQSWLGVDWRFPGDRYLSFGISSILFFYGGWPFLKGMWDEVSDRNPGMMTLIAVAIIVAYGYSSAVVFGLPGKTFFWELATLVVVMLAGHWVEMRSVMGTSRALDELLEMIPDEAHRIEDGETTDVPASELQKGDLILVKPGEKVPADGEIEEGESELNESMLTGESTPVTRGAGEEVVAGAVNGSGSLRIRITGAGEDSYLSKVVGMVEEAQKQKSQTQKLADRAAFWLTVVALSVGAVTLTVWLLVGREFSFALERMVTVMVISCPHALGLAIPLVVAISTAASARQGLLIRNRTAFENTRKVDTVVFDKTGTLTTGSFGLDRFDSLSAEYSKKEILKLAAGLEANSEHPLGEGIIDHLQEEDWSIPESSDFEAITGKGIRGRVEGKDVAVVSPAYLREKDIKLPDNLPDAKVSTRVFILVDEQLIGYADLSDQIRDESRDAIEQLHAQGIRTIMLTGDNERVAKHVSEELDMDEYYAGVLPDKKQNRIKSLQEEGAYVAMTGDGVNDAPALAQANLGIAIGSGTDVAAETADIILAESDPGDIVELLEFGKATYRKMVQNLFWATAYNVVAIPLAAGVLYQQGIMISPALGAALMSLSTVVVAANAQLLRRQLTSSDS